MDSELDKARKIVLEFTEGMNDWETKMFILSRIESGRIGFVSNEKYRKLVNGLSKESLNQLYDQILTEYCTQRDRKYGGHPIAYGRPPRYAGVCDESILDVVKIRSNRLEVTVESERPMGIYKFVLLKSGGVWKIDSLKELLGQEWHNSYL